MADIVNLRMARKAKARSAAEKQAQANRTLHGQTRAARDLAMAEVERAARLIDGHKRDGEG